jgi:hypothetical protein
VCMYNIHPLLCRKLGIVGLLTALSGVKKRPQATSTCNKDVG